MRIEIINEDIVKGKLQDSHNCPVALAIKRAYPGYSTVFVDRDEVRVDGWVYQLQPRMCKWIDDFDLRKEVRSTVFRLPLDELTDSEVTEEE